MLAKVERIDPSELELNDKLIFINRVTKVVKGGKRMGFAALVVTGDGKNHVGIGVGKAKEVPSAISKASANAKRNLSRILLNGTTVPHEIVFKYGAAQVLLKPAAPGTGIIAGGSVRAVLESTGIKDILTKSMGCSNKANVAKATLGGLTAMRDPKTTVTKRRSSLKEEAAGG
ncbi:MAG: 30S ribosomal protein S5 [Dehalococcoides mccartyi]|uniref:Small ribosomal subunit protein uS5 n=3 Tax=root TaxID=1 RepID=RS5_DEHM1|nr:MULTISPECIES: 30S ribosomal protein S5 [Dehalococcoides]Q3Z964.1 RecName: Full=Small ribosomal subunit protein uS5; AltName: Full=30S ribosomal protein S5 [Dehalococcoides mccartyi 195]AAW40275.1 ribosomal protein S5 [Dehalococcoides mccartyi 195]AII59176.1 30S ribosomal protein S5 [Dehalococcoides mccartyi CG4]KSV18699.1 30S ribosomal protein S5 [Dehalococcoides mccartyi]MBF4482647.1 30S ribosomal protein S5 [Dehalococcoides mccartyi]MBJ7532354.1 30S ribosomal protein S5 [Dehalococcoides 